MSTEVTPTEVRVPQISVEAQRKLNALAGLGTRREGSSVDQLMSTVVKRANEEAAAPVVEAPNPVSVAEKFAQAAKNPSAAPVQTPEVKVQAPVAEVVETPPATPEIKDIVIETPLLGKKVFKAKGAEPEEGAVDFKDASFEKVNTYIKSKFGDIEDMDAFTKKYSELQEQSKTFVEKEATLNNLEAVIASLPEDLYVAMQKHTQGQDWKDHIVNAPKIDVTKDLKSLDTQVLIDNYFPGQVSSDEWSEYNDEDGDPKTKKMIGILQQQAVEKFNSDKKKKESLLSETQATTKRNQQIYSDSVNHSMKTLKTEFPELDSNKTKYLAQNLSKNVIFDKFFDKNGNCLPEAAANLALLIDGRETIKQLMKYAEDMATTSANLDILSRGNAKPKDVNGKSGPNKSIRPEVLKMINDMTGGLNKRF